MIITEKNINFIFLIVKFRNWWYDNNNWQACRISERGTGTERHDKEKERKGTSMAKLDELLEVIKSKEIMKKEDDKKNCVLWILAIVGAVAVIAGIAYAVYRYMTPDYLDDFDDDFDDDFEDEEEQAAPEAEEKEEKAEEAAPEAEEKEAEAAEETTAE